MKTLMRWAVLLYPAAWRERYGAEFEALLEDVGPSGGDLWNVVRGAMAMQMTTWNFGKLLAACALAGAVLAGGWSLTLKDSYVSSAVMQLDGGEAGAQRLLKLQQSILSRRSLSEMITKSGLYKDERTTLPLEEIVDQMRNRDLRIQWVERAGKAVDSGGAAKTAFLIQFQAASPTAAQATVRELVAAFAEQNVQLKEGAVGLEVLDPASWPMSPSNPRRSRVMVMGLLAGLLLGLIAGGILTVVQRKAAWSLKRIGIFAAAGMTVGMAIAAMIPDRFVSTAVLRGAAGADVQAAIRQVLSEESLAAIIRQEGLYGREVSGGSMASAVEKMRNQGVQVRTVKGPAGEAFTVSFAYGDRAAARRVTGALATRFTAALPGVEVLDPASQPQAPSYPNRGQMALFGAFIGLLLGFAATRVRRPVAATA